MITVFVVFGLLTVMQLLTIYILAKRLHRIDPDLSVREYFWRLAHAQSALWLVFHESYLTKKPSGQPVHPSFVRHVGIMLIAFTLYLVLFLVFAFNYRVE